MRQIQPNMNITLKVFQNSPLILTSFKSEEMSTIYTCNTKYPKTNKQNKTNFRLLMKDEGSSEIWKIFCVEIKKF